MPYCPHCGNEVEVAIPWGMTEDKTVNAEVEIARINREADVEIARINASADRRALETAETIAETEAEAAVEVAAAEAEIIGDAIAESGPPDADPEPVIVQADPVIDDEPAPDDAPPETEGPGEPAPRKAKVGLGMW